MASEMIERVSMAYADAWKKDLNDYLGIKVISWNEMGGRQKDAMRRCSRAAIEAMREPTPEIIAALANAVPVTDDQGGWDYAACARAAWKVMIEAALAESGTK